MWQNRVVFPGHKKGFYVHCLWNLKDVILHLYFSELKEGERWLKDGFFVDFPELEFVTWSTIYEKLGI